MKKILLPVFLTGCTALFGQWQSTTNNTGKEVISAFSKVFSSNTNDNGLHSTTDNGANWSNSNTGVPAAGLNFGTFYNNTTLYAFKSNTVYSSPNGSAWSAMTGSFTGTDVIKSMTSLSGTVFAISSPVSGNGYKVWSLNGSSWGVKSSQSGTAAPIATCIRNLNGNLFAASTNTGVLKSTNAGASFTNSSSGITGSDKYVTTLGATSSALFAGTATGKIMRSTDNGATWTTAYNFGDGMSFAFVNDIYVLNNNNIMAATDSGFVYSVNGGTTWQKSNAGLNFSNLENYMYRVTVGSTHIIAGVATMSGTKIVRRPISEIFGSSFINENITVTDLKVYPNPANLFLNISSETLMFENNCFITVYDVTGKQLAEYKLEEGQTQIDLSSFASGIYTYTLSKDKAVVSAGKFIRE